MVTITAEFTIAYQWEKHSMWVEKLAVLEELDDDDDDDVLSILPHLSD